MYRSPIIQHSLVNTKSTNPNIKYAMFLNTYDINTDELERIMKEYLTTYTVQISISDYGQDFDSMIKMAKEHMVRQLAEDILKNEEFNLKFTVDTTHPYDTAQKTVTCKMEIFDFNKYNRVFRPERCIQGGSIGATVTKQTDLLGIPIHIGDVILGFSGIERTVEIVADINDKAVETKSGNVYFLNNIVGIEPIRKEYAEYFI